MQYNLQYNPQQNLNPPADNILPNTNPMPVTFNGATYLFYTGGAQNGPGNILWYTKTTNGGVTWAAVTPITTPGITQPQISVRVATSPSAAVFNVNKTPTLFVFYTGSGNDGIWYTTSTDGQNWIDPINIPMQPAQMPRIQTSTNAVVFQLQSQPALFVFYIGVGQSGDPNNANDNFGWYATTTNGTVWNTPTNIPAPVNLIMGSCPFGVVRTGTLYVFYSGSGGDGIYSTTFDGTNWASAPTSLGQIQSGAADIAIATWPTAFVLDYTNDIYLFWTTASSASIDTMVLSTAGTWSNVQNIGGSVTPAGVPVSFELADAPWVFWNGSGNNGVWFSNAVELPIDTSPTTAWQNIDNNIMFFGSTAFAQNVTFLNAIPGLQTSNTTIKAVFGVNAIAFTSKTITSNTAAEPQLMSLVLSLLYALYQNYTVIIDPEENVGGQSVFNIYFQPPPSS